MIALDALILLRPLWLLCLPVAGLLAVVAARRADGLARWRAVIDPALLPHLRQLGHVTEARRDPAPWLLGAAVALLALGLAGPATRNHDAPAFRNLDAVVLLLDVSPSMIDGGGFDDAQAAVSRLIDRHGTRPVALMLFAGESFVVSVPTEEPEPLQTVVAVIDADTMPVAGSRPDRALQMAQQVLDDAQANRADVVLITDGGGLGPDAKSTARDLAHGGARVMGVFVPQQAPPFGVPPANRAALQALTELGGGITVDATDTGPLEARLAERRGLTETEQARRAVLFTDHGRWLVALAILVLLPLFRQRRST